MPINSSMFNLPFEQSLFLLSLSLFTPIPTQEFNGVIFEIKLYFKLFFVWCLFFYSYKTTLGCFFLFFFPCGSKKLQNNVPFMFASCPCCFVFEIVKEHEREIKNKMNLE